jgi:chemotaxis protein CheC
VTAQHENVLDLEQLDAFRRAFHEGASEASTALGRWIDKPTRISFDVVEQLPLEEATRVLGSEGEPVCFCVAEMTGRLTGQLILAFSDASGLALADLLLGQPRGTAGVWGQMETSAALETANILACAFLNSLHRTLPADPTAASELLPTPPRFSRDYAASLIEFAVMAQVVATDHVLVAQTEFQIDGDPVDWTLLFVPDAESMMTLREALRDSR